MKTKSPQVLPMRLRLRILVGNDIALGPGKIELLQQVQQTHSIAEAARRMKMSYMRAWSLIQTMNRCFRTPVILTKRGGQERGGATLTQTGKHLLALSQRLESECLAASQTTRQAISSLLKKRP